MSRIIFFLKRLRLLFFFLSGSDSKGPKTRGPNSLLLASLAKYFFSPTTNVKLQKNINIKQVKYFIYPYILLFYLKWSNKCTISLCLCSSRSRTFMAVPAPNFFLSGSGSQFFFKRLRLQGAKNARFLLLSLA